jgi:hypothetical protein
VILRTSASPAQAQEANLGTDTSRVCSDIIIIDPRLALGKVTLLFPPVLQREARFAPLSFTDMHPGIAPPFPEVYGPKADLMSPFLVQTQKESKLSTIYTIIGAVELGAAANVAYRHIKKYGLR